MAKEKEVKHAWEGSTLKYEVVGQGTAEIDVSKLPENIIHEAVKFAFKTLARNATAGKLKEDAKAAFESVVDRFDNFKNGVWRATAGGEGVESKTSLLARAVAEVLGLDPADAAKRIEGMIAEKVEAEGLSGDEDDDKPAIRAIATQVKKAIGEMVEVAPVLARLRTEAAQEREKAAQEAAQKAVAEGKGNSIKDLMQAR